jgi:hypothetical protein
MSSQGLVLTKQGIADQEANCVGGRWGTIESNFVKSRWEKAQPFALILVAIGVLGALGYGGWRVYRYGWGDRAAQALLGSSGSVIVVALLVKMACRRQTIRIASWNVGTANDGHNMAFALASQMAGAKAMRHVKETRFQGFDARAVATARQPRLQEKMAELAANHCDVICLQETGDKNDSYLGALVPPGFGFLRLQQDNIVRAATAIVWNPRRVRPIAAATLTYEASMGHTDPDVIIAFETKKGIRFTVCSSHCRGFNLAQPSERSVASGDYQTIYNVKTMDQMRSRVHFEFYAGDLNTRSVDSVARRISYLNENGFTTTPDENDHPTIFDANLVDAQGDPLPVRLDHGYLRHGRRAVSLSSVPVSTQSLENLDRPSDHIPIGFDVRVS